MSRYFVPLTQAQPKNAMLDFSPVNQGLNAIGEAKQTATRNAMLQQQMDMTKEQHDWTRNRTEKQDARTEMEWYGKAAMAVDRMKKGSPERNAAFQRILQRHGGQGLTPEEMSPDTGPAMLAAQAGMSIDPLEAEEKRLGIDYKRAQLGALRDEQRQMAAVNGMLTGAEQPATPTPEAVPTEGAGRFAQPAVNPSKQPSVVFGSRELSPPQAMQVATTIAKRNPAMAKYLMDEVKRAQIEPKLLSMGIDPASAEGQTYMLTGRLPAKAYEKMANSAKRDELTGKVDAGLTNLLDSANTTNDTSFESALGPFQGSTPDSLAGAVPINIARVWGEISNFMGGGNISPSEVRSNITGATEALAGAIKPLIRGPGEGPWTDADQSRLVSIVGDLAQARNKDEYRRRLNSVRDRVRANFGLDLKFDAKGEGNDALRKKYGLE